eukprot:8531954-Pyramimonas_sp.AAC.1
MPPRLDAPSQLGSTVWRHPRRDSTMSDRKLCSLDPGRKSPGRGHDAVALASGEPHDWPAQTILCCTG